MEYLGYIIHKYIQMIEPSIAKIALATIISASFLFGDIYVQAMTAIIMLLTFDTITGVVATYHEGQPITSRRFGRVVLKSIVYLTSISAAYFTDLTVPGSFIQGTMIAFVGMTEFVSILENIGRLGFATPKKLLNQLNNKISNT